MIIDLFTSFSHDWTGLEPGAWNSILVFQMGGRDPIILSCAASKARINSKLGVKQSMDSKPNTLTEDLGVLSVRLTGTTRLPLGRILMLLPWGRYGLYQALCRVRKGQDSCDLLCSELWHVSFITAHGISKTQEPFMVFSSYLPLVRSLLAAHEGSVGRGMLTRGNAS